MTTMLLGLPLGSQDNFCRILNVASFFQLNHSDSPSFNVETKQ